MVIQDLFYTEFPQGNYFKSEPGNFNICMQYVFTLHGNALNKILSHSVFVFVIFFFRFKGMLYMISLQIPKSVGRASGIVKADLGGGE